MIEKNYYVWRVCHLQMQDLATEMALETIIARSGRVAHLSSYASQLNHHF